MNFSGKRGEGQPESNYSNDPAKLDKARKNFKLTPEQLMNATRELQFLITETDSTLEHYSAIDLTQITESMKKTNPELVKKLSMAVQRINFALTANGEYIML